MQVTRVVAVIFALGFVAPRARADTGDQLYSEVRDLIDEVIRAEVAKHITDGIRREHPALCFYMRGALQRMQSSYWGAVPGQLREGIGTMAADFAYWYLTRSDDAMAKAEPAACVKLRKEAATEGAFDAFREFLCVRDKALRDQEVGTEKCTLQSWSTTRTLVELSCDGEQNLPCILAKVGLTTLHGQHRESRSLVTDYVVDQIGREFGTDTQLFHLIVNGTKDVAAFYKEIGGRFARFEKHVECKISFGLPADSPCWYLDLADKVTSTQIEVKFHEPPAAGAEALSGAVIKEFSVTLPELAGYITAPKLHMSDDDWDQISSKLGKVSAPAKCSKAVVVEIKSTLLELNGSINVSEDGVCQYSTSITLTHVQNLAELGRGWKALKQDVELLDRELDDFGIDHGLTAASFQEALAKVRKLAFKSVSVRGLLRSDEQSEVQQSMESLMRTIRIAFKDRGGAAGEVFTKIEALHKNPAFGLLVKLFDTQDYRELAVSGLTIALERTGLDPAEKAFLVEFASYVLDAGVNDNQDRSLAKQALRDAIKRLLLTAKGDGLPTESAQWLGKHRPCGNARCALFTWATYVDWSWKPVIALRWDFAGQWYNRPGVDYRRTLSVEALSLAIPFSDHIGLKASLFDLASPFSELAFRDTTATYDDAWKLALDVLHPRADFWLMAPELTRRIGAFAGVAASPLHRPETTRPCPRPSHTRSTGGPTGASAPGSDSCSGNPGTRVRLPRRARRTSRSAPSCIRRSAPLSSLYLL